MHLYRIFKVGRGPTLKYNLDWATILAVACHHRIQALNSLISLSVTNILYRGGAFSTSGYNTLVSDFQSWNRSQKN